MPQEEVGKQEYEQRLAEVEELKKNLPVEILNMHPNELDITARSRSALNNGLPFIDTVGSLLTIPKHLFSEFVGIERHHPQWVLKDIDQALKALDGRLSIGYLSDIVNQ